MNRNNLILFLFSLILISCGKDEVKCTAGNGGNVTLLAFGKHHGDLVKPTSIHIKFNSSEYPGDKPSDYDLNIAADTTQDHILVRDLKCGNYYIYMTGYDAAIFEVVKGGIPYTIDENKSGNVNLDIPITE